MYKKVNVVMLPVNKSNMCRIIDLEDNIFKFNIQPNQDAFIDTVDKGFHVEPFHLYILSDDELKKGDWKICLNDNVISKYLSKKSIESDTKCKDCKKIITTTNKSLIALFGQSEEGYGKMKEGLPQIPQSFIEYYVSEYNKGNIITEVMICYDHFKTAGEGIVTRLQVNQLDNTINIKPIKINKYEDLYKAIDKIKEGHNGSAINFIERFINTQTN